MSGESYELYNGLKIPVIGFGTFPNKEVLLEAIPAAVKKGYRLIDTSDNYQNEEYVGKAFQKILREKETDEDILIVTKFSQPYLTVFFNKVFRQSQKKLYGDTQRKVDIYLLHWPYPFLWKKQWKRMEKLYTQGKCKAIGVCNFKKRYLEELLQICQVKPMIDQFECHPLFQQKETVEFCRENDIRIMSYSPLARMNKKLIENELLVRLADKYGKSVQQIILRWNIEHEFIPIPASVSKEHINSNFEIFDFKLTSEEIAQIDELESGMRVRFDPDSRFTTGAKLRFWLCGIFVR